MKEIRETKLVEQTTVRYIACDGKEFTDEKECVVYERRLDKEKTEKEFKKLKPIKLDFPFMDVGGYVEAAYLITFKSEADFDTAVDYYASKSQWMDLENLVYYKPETFPETMIVFNGEEWVCTHSNVENAKEDLMKVYKQLGGN